MITSKIQDLWRESISEAAFLYKPNEFFILLLQKCAPYGCVDLPERMFCDSLKGLSSEWIMANFCMLAHFIDHFDICFVPRICSEFSFKAADLFGWIGNQTRTHVGKCVWPEVWWKWNFLADHVGNQVLRLLPNIQRYASGVRSALWWGGLSWVYPAFARYQQE